MNEKIELVLIELINLYLKELVPISSIRLKKKSNLPFSASSIRGYMQKLQENGLIEKNYLSSGSKPSKKALKNFWKENFKNFDLNFDNLEEKIKKNNLYFGAKIFENELLVKVDKYNKFIILEFENNELIFRYDNNLFYFFKSLEGLSLYQIKSYLYKLNLTKILKKVDTLPECLCYNKHRLYELSKLIDIESFMDFKFDNIQNGLNIFNLIVVYKNVEYFNNKIFEYVIVGDIYSNFLNLFQKGG